jgi:hypothetical protein
VICRADTCDLQSVHSSVQTGDPRLGEKEKDRLVSGENPP